MPVPVVPLGSEIQETLLWADQPQAAPVLTKALLVLAPAPSVTLVGETEYSHALWFTVRVWPAIDMVPVREPDPVLAAMLSPTTPPPVPLWPDVTEIHDEWLEAVHAQPVLVNTHTLEVAAAVLTVMLVGEIE